MPGASCGRELGRDRHGELAVGGGWHERLRHMAHGLGLELKPTLHTPQTTGKQASHHEGRHEAEGACGEHLQGEWLGPTCSTGVVLSRLSSSSCARCGIAPRQESPSHQLPCSSGASGRKGAAPWPPREPPPGWRGPPGAFAAAPRRTPCAPPHAPAHPTRIPDGGKQPQLCRSPPPHNGLSAQVVHLTPSRSSHS